MATVDRIRHLTVGREPDELLFVTKVGTPILHGNFHGRVWKPAIKKAPLGTTDQMSPTRAADPIAGSVPSGLPRDALSEQGGRGESSPTADLESEAGTPHGG